jgi:hypothetical protein
VKKTRLIGVALSVLLTTASAFAEAGLSEMRFTRAFWVVCPFALEQAVDDPEDVTLFAGCSSRWYDIWRTSNIEHIGWDDWDVKHVTAYGVHQESMICGTTRNGRWFIANTRGGRLPWYYDDETSWRAAIVALGGPSAVKMLSFDEGFRASQRQEWLARMVKWSIVVIAVSVPWFIFLRLRVRRLRRLASDKGSS